MDLKVQHAKVEKVIEAKKDIENTHEQRNVSKPDTEIINIEKEGDGS